MPTLDRLLHEGMIQAKEVKLAALSRRISIEREPRDYLLLAILDDIGAVIGRRERERRSGAARIRAAVPEDGPGVRER